MMLNSVISARRGPACHHSHVAVCKSSCKVQRCRAVRPCAALQQSQEHPNWLQRVLSAGLAASVAMSTVVTPVVGLGPATAMASQAVGVENAAMHHHSHAQPGTAAAEYTCTPLTTKERAGFMELDGFTYKIHTSSPVAQALFDQGLLLTYNFNRTEAINSFKAGLEVDPDAPMLHWGLAHALGIYANKVWGPAPADHSYETITPQDFEQAKKVTEVGLAAAQKALAASPSSPQLQAELAYLEAEHGLWASVQDYEDPAIYGALEQYAKRFESIAQDYPSDPNPPALAAEARMNISPWQHWEGPLQNRKPIKADTVVMPALRNIAETLRRYPGHPLASHLMIHLSEAGTPGGGLPAEPGFAALGESAADSLAFIHPYTSMGHLVHMPGHTYMRLGRWHDAMTTNQAALETDKAAAKRCIQPYMPEHNSQQLIYAAANTGQLQLAEQQAKEAVTYPKLFGPTHMSDGLERISLTRLQARFAKWGPILERQPADFSYANDGVMVPPGADMFGQGMYHYTRALAFASAAAHETGDAARQAEQQMGQEVDGLAQIVKDMPDDVITRPGEGLGVYSIGYKHLSNIELLAARARGDVLRGNLSGAADKLKQAIQVDYAMGYMEPPRQYQPMQECLGWVLLQQGKLDQAEQAYLDDLAEYPDNPWGLKGLAQVYAAMGPTAAEKRTDVETRFAAAWSHADPGLELHSSCPAFSD